MVAYIKSNNTFTFTSNSIQGIRFVGECDDSINSGHTRRISTNQQIKTKNRVIDKILSCSHPSRSFWLLAKITSQNCFKTYFPSLITENGLVNISKRKVHNFYPLIPRWTHLQIFLSQSTDPVPYAMPPKILQHINAKRTSDLDRISSILKLFEISENSGIFLNVKPNTTHSKKDPNLSTLVLEYLESRNKSKKLVEINQRRRMWFATKEIKSWKLRQSMVLNSSE